MPDFTHDEATAKRALDVVDQLLAARDRIASGVGGIAFLREHEAVAPVAWSWWMLIADSARVVAKTVVTASTSTSSMPSMPSNTSESQNVVSACMASTITDHRRLATGRRRS
jgi:hypothetical protein